ncbi:MAG TPA: PhoU domain-containing protein [Solirubrobacteraceae bacterium]|jgi:phosphate transport system protein|nr:PhoU domain-containing protein [Solirubrobacteraceae bacterium]
MPTSGQGRPHFQELMRELEVGALGALDMVIGQLDRVLDAVATTDLALAEFVIADDDRVDGRYLEVHQGVLSLLALQAPVAGDLRIVAAVLHLINAVERIGDQCVNIAKLIPLPASTPPHDNEIVERIMQMGAAAGELLAQARTAFAERDVEVAHALSVRNREVDRLNLEVFRLAVVAGEDPGLREWAMLTTLIARALERIASNACDIAEQAIFIETGNFGELAAAPARDHSS